MSIRSFVRIVALALGLVLASPLAWRAGGPFLALAGLGLLGLTVGYLVLQAGGGDLSRWQVRYHLEPGATSPHLEAVLAFLAERAGHLVVEASAGGLVLELPRAFDCYVEAQLPKVLPELKLSRVGQANESQGKGASFFSLGPAHSDLLHWATEGTDRQVRLHIHPGPMVTIVAQTDGSPPPGRWLRIRLPRRFRRHFPLWDELSAGVRLSSLLPPTGDGVVYSSRSHLFQLTPPDDYTPEPGGRVVGRAADGHPLMLGRDVQLFTVAAPSSFLARQALDDLAVGQGVLVISPRRRTLEQIEQEAEAHPVHWLDPLDTWKSVHLAIVAAEEWEDVEIETVIEVTEAFLAGLGIDLALPAVGDFVHCLLEALVEHARRAGRDLAFTDLYAVSRSTQVLRTFLREAPGEAAQALRAQLDRDAGYVQAVTNLSAIRDTLKPLSAGPLHALCQPLFLDLHRLATEVGLLLVPMTDGDFPENDRLLSAMLDLSLRRLLATGDDSRLALHLHDAHCYRDDGGRPWVDVARHDSRLALLMDIQDPQRYSLLEDGWAAGEIAFRFSEPLAANLVAAWQLPVSAADLSEMPTGVALARLGDMVVTLKTEEA